MKNSSFIFAGALALFAVACTNAPKSQFTLNGEVEGLDGQEVYLYVNNHIDTTVIENGKFTFTDTLSHETMAAILVGEQSYENRNHVAQFFISPSEMTITLPTDSFPGFTLVGSPAEDLNKQLIDEQAALTAQAMDLRMQMAQADPAKADSLEKDMEGISQKLENIMFDFIKDNPDSYVAAHYSRFVAGRAPYEKLKELYECFTPRIKQSSELSDLRTEIAALEKVQPGSPAPNIKKKDINGNEFDMSALKGKVIILDFWASWCGPCRKSNPHVKALYDKYHAKGLEVVMVSDDDSNESAWLKAVADDKLEAFHHVLRGLKRNPEGSAEPFDKSEDVSAMYAIHFLPTKYLIDSNFNIIGKVMDEEMDAKLKEIFGE